MFKFEYTIISIMLFVIVIIILIASVIGAPDAPDAPQKKYKACNNGDFTQCIRFDEYEVQGNCLIGENGERICGEYILKVN